MNKEFKWIEKVEKGANDWDRDVKESAKKYDKKVLGKEDAD